MKLRVIVMVACVCGSIAAGASAQTVDLASSSARQIVSGSLPSGRAGTWVAVGDVNGDINNKDLFIGAPGANSGRGEVRVLFGWLRQSTGDFSLDLADVVFSGANTGDQFGASVDAGFITQRETVPATNSRDLIVGAPGALSGRGEVYVFAGPLAGGTALTPSNAIIRIRGAAGDQLGAAVESADLNNDGFREIVAGAPGTGRVYIIDYHNAPTATLDLSTQAATLTIAGAGIGNALSVGDITADSVFDLAIGAPTAAAGAGAVYVVNGRPSGGLPSVVSLPAGANETFTGFDAGDHAGTSVWIKDFDGDGIWDLSMTAPDADGPSNSRLDAGDAYVVFGRAGLPAALAPDTVIYGASAGSHTGTWARSGDITKDEPDDLALLASGANAGMGAVYVVYGRPRHQYPAVIDLATQADRLIISDETVGGIQSTAVWEVTGEGAEDIVFGVPTADSGVGRVYLSISPRMSVTPNPIYVAGVQGSTPSVAVTVGNGGAVPITWSATPQVGYLSVSSTTGSSAITAPGSFTLTAALTGIPPGLYSPTIDVNSTSNNLAHRSRNPVLVAVLSPPTITVDHAFPVSWGEPLTWTAQASAPGATLLYEFYRFDSAGGWRKVQPFSTSNTYSWTPTAQDAGDHTIQVWVKTTYSPSAYDAWAGTSSFTITRPVPTIASFTNDGIFPMAPNTPVQFAVTATRGSAPLEYAFYAYREGAGWSLLQNYSASSSATWTPTVSGNYVVQAWVRSMGVTSAYEAFAATNVLRVTNTEPVRVLSLTPDKPFPARAGQSISFSAVATGGSAGPLQYQFVRYDEGSGWTIVQTYGSQRTYTWTPGAGAAGNHILQVWVRSAGVTAPYEGWVGTDPFSVVVDPLTSPSLSADVVFPVPTNTSIKWTATVSGGIAPLEYKFFILKSGGVWTLARDYATSNTFTWTPGTGAEGSYALQVWIRNAGSSAAYDTWVGTPYFTIGPSGPARVVSVTANQSLPAPSGSTIVWTAIATGGTAGPLQFKFVRYNQGTGLWTIVQDYSASNTFTWTPAATEAGTYTIQAWVRSAGSSAMYEGWAATGYFVVK